MKGTKENPFENIFEAIESIDPESIIIPCNDSCFNSSQLQQKLLDCRGALL